MAVCSSKLATRLVLGAVLAQEQVADRLTGRCVNQCRNSLRATTSDDSMQGGCWSTHLLAFAPTSKSLSSLIHASQKQESHFSMK
jgi:hypothetical protein